MESTQFKFKVTILGQEKELVVNVPVRNGYVITSEFTPKGISEIQNPDLNFLNVTETLQGETISEFKSDCKFLLNTMKDCIENSRLDVHLCALQYIVEAHLRGRGRIIFTDLLLYVDCFSLLLRADGFDEKMVRGAYPVVTYNLVEMYDQFVKDQYTLQPFKQSPIYATLLNILQNS